MTPQETATIFNQVYRLMFTDSEWDLIYNYVGHALDNDEEDSEMVYSIRNKIHSIFDEE
jgi:hypothetical protein